MTNHRPKSTNSVKIYVLLLDFWLSNPTHFINFGSDLYLFSILTVDLGFTSHIYPFPSSKPLFYPVPLSNHSSSRLQQLQQNPFLLPSNFLIKFIPNTCLILPIPSFSNLISVLIISKSKKSKFTPSSSSSQKDFRVFLKNPTLEDDYLRISQLEILPGRFVKYEDFNDYDIVSYLQFMVFILYFLLNQDNDIIPS